MRRIEAVGQKLTISSLYAKEHVVWHAFGHGRPMSLWQTRVEFNFLVLSMSIDNSHIVTREGMVL